LSIICNAVEGSISRTGVAAAGRIGHFIETKSRGYSVGEIFFDMSQVNNHRLTHVQMLDLGKLKHQRRGNVRLFTRS
jgi:hypothetical protein